MLKLSDPSHEILFDHCSDGIAVFDLDLNCIFWNTGMETLTDMKGEEVIGKHAFEIFPLLKKNRSGYFNSALEGKITNIYEDGFILPSGKAKKIEITSFPYKDQKGKVIGGIHLYKDLTQSRQNVEKIIFHNTILENVSDSIIATDLQGRVTYWNKGAEEVFQYTEQEVLGKTMEFINPEGAASINSLLDSIKQNLTYSNEWKGIRKDGSIVWLLAKTSLLKDQDGNDIGFLGVSKDITEKLFNENKLREKDIRYKELLESAPVSIVILQEGRIVFANETSANLIRAGSVEEVIGMNVLDLIHPESIEKVKERMAKVFAGGKVESTEHKIIGLQGEVKEIESIGNLVEYEGKPAAQVILYDITQRNKALNDLKESEEKIKNITNEIPGVVFQFYVYKDGSDSLMFLSDHLYEAIDLPADHRFSIKDTYRWIYPYDLYEFKRSVKRSVREKCTWDHEFRYINNEGESNWVRGTAALEIMDTGVLKFTGFLKDINERKQAEQLIKNNNLKLKLLTRHLEHVREDEKKRISMEIHDGIGQDLTGIKLEMYWLKKKISELEITDKQEAISKKVDELLEITGNVIEDTRRIAYELRPVLLDKVGLVPALEHLISSFSELNHVTCQSVLKIGDIELSNNVSNSIYRIFQETLNNITKHAAATKVNISLVSDNENIIINIKDNGAGIDIAELERSGKLGLFNIEERVKAWHGEFNLSTNIGNGTAIEIVLPIANLR